MLASVLVAVACLVAGCGGGGGGGAGDTAFTAGSSTQQRNLSPVSTASAQTSLVSGVNATGVALLQLSNADSNAVVAPYSASLAVAMLRSGATGSTRDSLDQFLHLTAVTEDVDAAFNKLDLGLKGRLFPAGGASVQSIVGWSQTGFSVRRSFLDALAVNYGLTTGHADFAHDLDGALAAENSWLQQWPAATNFTVGNANTRLVLGSGMKLSLAWQEPFDPALTAPGPFQLLDNSTETVSYLHQTATIKTAAGDGYLALALPLAAGQQFLIVMPDQDRFSQVSGVLTADRWEQIAQSLTPTLVDLALPVFSKRLSCSIDLGAASRASSADFSGIDGTRQLFVRDLWHSAFLSIDAAGLAAQSSTLLALEQAVIPPGSGDTSGVIISNGGFNWLPVIIGIARPFFFAVRDTQTGTMLFLGRVLDPLS